ncbi:NAD(P)/FAD-dependent oxidoreductase [Thalassoglobus polymorphus]|uniref:Anaerobic glycerol-3-phosphate dehydrogenase subunit A n=1 Tax=Thalassoglobus polymorphus TaxID=2527994 RepID=A0A517QJM4_9PLAN|nr:FAD-dependent oxidoreductase [Thalassoglobus polymorphus]QDT31846.1 Anaerobic glycerol-3-phosphate dehydrogenase subunit A [Thalassoglobus polymorphus]
MAANSHVERILIVGGGFSGLASATQLSQAGFPVTLLETSKLGHAASTENQGWLYSGASFAQIDNELATRCHKSLLQTVQFCPECLEPEMAPMIFGSMNDSDRQKWTSAWDAANLPYRELTEGEASWNMPQVDRKKISWLLRLPDRSFRPHVLLDALSVAARAAGVEIRSGTFVSKLLTDKKQVYGVELGTGEELRGQLVILAVGAASRKSFYPLFENVAGEQPDYELVYVKSHLLAIEPVLSLDPFHLVDQEGFNHVPHESGSVFGSERWKVVQEPKDTTVNPEEIRIIEERVKRLLPGAFENAQQRKEWAGITVQALHPEEINPTHVFRPTIIDHATQPKRFENVISIFPGRATLWADLAENVGDFVSEKVKRSSSKTATPPWMFT